MNKTKLQEKIKELEKENEKLKSKAKYGLSWEEKEEKFEKNMKKHLPILEENLSKKIINDKDNKNNLLIEGDNYHSLTNLLYTHKRKIDVIYIDPPYNTGNEFVYNDKKVDKEDSYKHSKWLSFMNKRLKLAKELLSNDGIIFISIDDNEQAQLKLLCDKVFGEKNFLTQFDWVYSKSDNLNEIKTTGSNLGDIKKSSEYVLSYKKTYDCILHQVNRFFASSQNCSKCGTKNPQVKDLSIRKWTCKECGAIWDRDINAGLNLLQQGKLELGIN